MAVAQRMKPSKARQMVWDQMFPPQAIMNKQLSSHCMKKLLILGVSSVAYLRNLFPHSAFGDRAVEDIQLKILRDNAPSEESRQLVTWIKSLLPAIEQRFVNKIVLGVYDAEKMPQSLPTAEALLESYTFKFGSISEGDYVKLTSSKQSSMHLPTAREFKANTLMMLRTILLSTQALEKLPDVCVIALKVYYNEVVPSDFSPEGFEPDVAEGPDAFAFHKTQRVRINLGGTATHHDALKVYLQTHQTLFNGEADGSPTTTASGKAQSLEENAQQDESEPGPAAMDCGLEVEPPPPAVRRTAATTAMGPDPFGFCEVENVNLSEKLPAPAKAKMQLPSHMVAPKRSEAKRRRRQQADDDPNPFAFRESQTDTQEPEPQPERAHVAKRALRVTTARK